MINYLMKYSFYLIELSIFVCNNICCVGPSVLKHLIQNSSLLGQLDKSGLLENGNTFIEFGSGRGQLTYWLTRAVTDPSTCQFILVDKASHRHKFDNRLTIHPSSLFNRYWIKFDNFLTWNG